MGTPIERIVAWLRTYWLRFQMTERSCEHQVVGYCNEDCEIQALADRW